MTTPEPAGNVLAVRGLVVEARAQGGWSPIVCGVDLDVRRGEVLGLIGESGAGKSTIGLAAMGYARAGCRISAGTIIFDGEDLRRCAPARLQQIRGRRVAYVAQSAAAAFNPATRVIDQHVEAATLHGGRDARAARADAVALYRTLRLPDPERIGERYPHELSGGQLQRAMVAMAMSCRPDLIVFDEPTTALDVTTQLEVLVAVKQVIAQSGVAALYISHDLAVVAQMADRILVLRHGAAVEHGPAAALLAAPRSDYTRRLIAARAPQERRAAPGAAVLELVGVAAAYPRSSRAVEHVDLTVGRGATLALVGESGSGKSTVGRVIAGLMPPVSGTLTFEGRPLPPTVARRARALLWAIQLVHQVPDSALNPRQRVRELLGRVVSLRHGLAGAALDRRVRELLAMVELAPDVADRLPGALSGGQKQRVCIARAIAADPRLIICDEVTSALDPLVARGIIDLLFRLQRELGLSYLFITHDLSLVPQIAERVVVMERGRVVEEGPSDDVLTRPRHPYTARLVRSVPRMEAGWLARQSR
jgi:peptide/nickel transport system ATP-binding protein